MIVQAFKGEREEAAATFAAITSHRSRMDDARMLMGYATIGDREAANRYAAMIDTKPAGPAFLLVAVKACQCGAPFDLEAAPNFAKRIEEAGFAWPPQELLDYKSKDW